MSRKSLFMLVGLLVLWTALPAFACFLPSAEHACCRHMSQPCVDVNSVPACCQARPAEKSPPQDQMVRGEGLPDCFVAQTVAVPVLDPMLLLRARTVAASPPPDSSTRSILRI